MHGITTGAEASIQWTVAPRWTLSPGYSYLQMHLHTDSTSLDTVVNSSEVKRSVHGQSFGASGAERAARGIQL
jgi:hypothetical protein